MHCDSAEWYAWPPPFWRQDQSFPVCYITSHDPSHDSNIDAIARSLNLHDVESFKVRKYFPDVLAIVVQATCIVHLLECFTWHAATHVPS